MNIKSEAYDQDFEDSDMLQHIRGKLDKIEARMQKKSDLSQMDYVELLPTESEQQLYMERLSEGQCARDRFLFAINSIEPQEKIEKMKIGVGNTVNVKQRGNKGTNKTQEQKNNKLKQQ